MQRAPTGVSEDLNKDMITLMTIQGLLLKKLIKNMSPLTETKHSYFIQFNSFDNFKIYLKFILILSFNLRICIESDLFPSELTTNTILEKLIDDQLVKNF